MCCHGKPRLPPPSNEAQSPKISVFPFNLRGLYHFNSLEFLAEKETHFKLFWLLIRKKSDHVQA